MVLKETNLSGVQKGVLKYGWLFDQSVGGAFRGCNSRRGVHRGCIRGVQGGASSKKPSRLPAHCGQGSNWASLQWDEMISHIKRCFVFLS